MKPLLATRIKEVLLANRPLGITAQGIADALKINVNTVRVMLNGMRDAYIYKWAPSVGGTNYVAVWKGVIVPPNAERPPGKNIKRCEYDNRYRERKKAGLVVKRAPRKKPIEVTPEPPEPPEPPKPAPTTGVRTQIRGPWPKP